MTNRYEKNLNIYNPDGSLNLDNKNLVNLKGIISKEINGSLYCRNNKLTTLEHCPKKINGVFDVKYNKELKNIKQQIVENQIKAYRYETDEGEFWFEDIKDEFIKYEKYLIKEKEKKEKKRLLETNQKLKFKTNNQDYGLSI